MKKDEIFFACGNEDIQLTKTSANFISNLAKEMYQHVEQELENIKFYTETVQLIGSPQQSLLRQGISTVREIEGNLGFIAQLKSLIAWLREGIKAKERLENEVKRSSFEDFAIELPTHPEEPDEVTEDDIVGNWGIKQRNRYFYLQTMCAQLGEYIHSRGTYSRERLALQKVTSEPNRIEGSGRDTLLYTRTPSLPTQEVEDTFMQLQQVYRSYQAELNAMKHELQIAVDAANLENRNTYESALREYKTAMSIADTQLQKERQKALTVVQNLKIIIPDSLRSTYNRVQETGKKK